MNFRTATSTFFSLFADIFFPPVCVYCSDPTDWICKDCTQRISLYEQLPCFGCKQYTDGHGKTCRHCHKTIFVDRVVIAAPYKQLSLPIHALKYTFAQDVAKSLAPLIARAYMLHIKNHGHDMCIPLPLHKKRHRWRGFNQSELLAQVIKHDFNTAVFPPIDTTSFVRKKNTKTQMTLSRTHRQKNMIDVFHWQSKNAPPNSILLIDDVITTGSSIISAAKALKAAGTTAVTALLLAGEE
jgi:ComF family protein